jgi:hypothetical protein
VQLHQTGNQNPVENVQWFQEIFERTTKYCTDVGFMNAAGLALAMAINLKSGSGIMATVPLALQARLDDLETAIDLDLVHQQFVAIKQDRIRFFESKALFGEPVDQCFPSARIDISDAGNCIAVDLNSAAVFHLMRAVEGALRAFAVHLGVSKVSAGRTKNRWVPLEYAQWEQILNQLPDRIEAKINKLPSGPKKQAAQEFYYGTLKDFSGFKEAWRNHVSHARAHYSSESALAVLSHVERFMQTLADHRISESKRGK